MKKTKLSGNTYFFIFVLVVCIIVSVVLFIQSSIGGGICFLCLAFVCALFVRDDIKKARNATKESSVEAEADAAKKAAIQQVNGFLEKNDYAGLSDWLSTSQYSISGLENFFQKVLTHIYVNNTLVNLPELKKIQEQDKGGELFPFVCLAIEKILPTDDKIFECYLSLIDIWHDQPQMLEYFNLIIAAIYDEKPYRRQRLTLHLERIIRQKISHFRKPHTVREIGKEICIRKVANYKKYFDVFAQEVLADKVSYWLFTRPGNTKQAFVTYSLDNKFPMMNVMRGPLPPTPEGFNPYDLFTMHINRESYLKNMHRQDCKRFDHFAK